MVGFWFIDITFSPQFFNLLVYNFRIDADCLSAFFHVLDGCASGVVAF
jgi:hypothetical protein